MTKTKVREVEPVLFAEGVASEPAATTTVAVTAKPPGKRAAKNEVVKFEPKIAPPNMLAVIASAAANPSVDVTKLEALYKLYQETEGKQQFHDALLGIELPSIDRDGRIPVSGGKALRFASFENVHKAVMPLLRTHGFRMSFQPMPSANGEGLVVECRLIRGTYEEKCVVPISTAPASRAMNSQQAIGAAIKYASRYGMMYLLNLRSEAPEDRDTDGNPPKQKGAPETVSDDPDAAITGPQAKELLKAIDDCGITAARFIEKYKVTAVQLLPATMFAEAIKSCKDYKARADAAKKS